MKKMIAMAFTALLITVAANAQIQRIQDSTFEKNKPARHKLMIRDDFKQLNLTEEQKKKIKENQEDLTRQREAVEKDASLTPEQKKSKMLEIQKKSREMNKQILTTEQKEKMKTSQDDRSRYKVKEQKMKGNRAMKGQGKQGQEKYKKMKDEQMKQLDLSVDQQAKMKNLRLKLKEESAAIKNNTRLTEEQKKQQLKDLRGKNKEQMSNLLTPEQKMKMKENRGEQQNIRDKRSINNS